MKRFKWSLIGLIAVGLVMIPLTGCIGASKCEYRDFSSLSELQDWLLANDVSERPPTEYAEGWYSKALDIQEDALGDGYIISVDYDYDEVEDLFRVWCVTIIDGDIWLWSPETDEPLHDDNLGKVK